jgi:hypothetical protein
MRIDAPAWMLTGGGLSAPVYRLQVRTAQWTVPAHGPTFATTVPLTLTGTYGPAGGAEFGAVQDLVGSGVLRVIYESTAWGYRFRGGVYEVGAAKRGVLKNF